MINNPKSEPYYSYLIRLGYVFCNYSEKHYIFEKDGRVIKVAKSIYNNESTDESYFIERAAHSLLLSYKFPVTKIYNVYPKGEFLKGYAVLEEEKIEEDSVILGITSILQRFSARSLSGILSTTLYKKSFHDKNLACPFLSITPKLFPLIFVVSCIKRNTCTK